MLTLSILAAVAEAAVRLLQQFGLERDSGPAHRAFYFTDAPDHVESVARRFWDQARVGTIRLEHIDLMDGVS